MDDVFMVRMQAVEDYTCILLRINDKAEAQVELPAPPRLGWNSASCGWAHSSLLLQ